MKPPQYSKLPPRFWDKVEVAPNGCWEWQAGGAVGGYGTYYINPKMHRSNRLSIADKNGGIPDGMLALHHCDNPPCVNPDHLYLGTAKDNSNDMHHRGRMLVGERHSRSKTTEADVLEIRELYASGNHTHQELAGRYGLKRTTIGAITNKLTWKHI